jgi:hypothetical protein
MDDIIKKIRSLLCGYIQLNTNPTQGMYHYWIQGKVDLLKDLLIDLEMQVEKGKNHVDK